MRKSVLLQKVFLVIIVTLLVTLLLTMGIYTIISRTMFADIRTLDMLPRARSLARLIESEGGRDYGEILKFLTSDGDLLGGYFIVTDDQGNPVAYNERLSPEVFANIHDLTSPVLRGEEITSYSRVMLSTVQLVGVGTPIRQGDRITGAVLIFVPLYETMAAVNGLNGAMMLSVLIVLPLTVVLVYLVIGRITLPLRQMRDTALSMASGNFSVKADDTQRGEVGQLAASLNYLSRELSHNLSQLTIARNRLIQAVDGLQEGFVSLDSMGRVTYFNQAMRALFDIVEEQPHGRMDIVHDEALWAAFDGTIEKSEPSVRDLKSRERLIRARINPVMDESGHTVGAVGLFTDVTESERLERTRRDYVANVSHELRTPLTAMRGLIEPLKDGMVRSEETRMRYYDILLRETLRLSRLIDDLMELSRLQSGKLSLEKHPVRLGPIVEDLADKYAYTAHEKNQVFELKCDPARCPTVMTNEDRAEQVLVILLDNAMKYTPEGGTITLDVRVEPNQAVLSVSDTGIGISEEDLPYVFDRFYKADKAHTGANGSGLGLSIAREILESMGEQITVTSEIGRGTTFSFTLQRAPGDENLPVRA